VGGVRRDEKPDTESTEKSEGERDIGQREDSISQLWRKSDAPWMNR
jgi:hypothetical protein